MSKKKLKRKIEELEYQVYTLKNEVSRLERTINNEWWAKQNLLDLVYAVERENKEFKKLSESINTRLESSQRFTDNIRKNLPQVDNIIESVQKEEVFN